MQLPHSKEWMDLIGNEFVKPYFRNMEDLIDIQRRHGVGIYPQQWEVFKAFDFCSPSNIKVVIIGQDPYHQPKMANGMCFSVDNDCAIPGSLRNIFKALKVDLGIENKEGDLTQWALQGVFLLNTILTVERGKPLSHSTWGWETFTDKVITEVNKIKRPIVWMLWGNQAKQKKELIKNKKHLVIESSHPSPNVTNSEFLWHKPFSQANDFLMKNNIQPIDWYIK